MQGVCSLALNFFFLLSYGMSLHFEPNPVDILASESAVKIPRKYKSVG